MSPFDKSLETNPQNHRPAGQQCKSESNESTWKEADSTHPSRSRPVWVAPGGIGFSRFIGHGR